MQTEESRTKILKELEQLRDEHFEKQRLDENFYRHSEKIGVLTDQLHDAKNSLSQIKLDSMDNTLFANRVIENFSSVSPTRKRRIPQDSRSPKTRRSRVSLFNELELTPTRDFVTKDFDPMSMTDEEFDQIFLPKKSVSTPSIVSAKKDSKNSKREKSSKKSTPKHHKERKAVLDGEVK